MTVVLDASALLAVILGEDGDDYVSDFLADAHLSTVNLSEATSKLLDYGLTIRQVRKHVDRMELTIHAFDTDHAELTANLRKPTASFGLSLCDRACLSLGQRLGLPILTADRRMAESAAITKLDIRQIR